MIIIASGILLAILALYLVAGAIGVLLWLVCAFDNWMDGWPLWHKVPHEHEAQRTNQGKTPEPWERQRWETQAEFEAREWRNAQLWSMLE
jgi:hypothetical protein